MKRKNWKNYLLIVCLSAGFLAGIVYENIAAKNHGVTISFFQSYYLQQYVQTTIVPEEFFWYVAQIRIFPFVILCALGYSRWKKAAVVCALGWTGFLTGILTVSSVVQLGIKGIFLCLLGCVPHVFLYAVSYGILGLHLYFYPENRWSGSKTVITVIFLLVGVITETYINPVILKWMIQFI